MPETSMYEQNFPPSLKHKIRLTWKTTHVRPKFESERSKEVSDHLFWRGVAASNSPHVFTSLFRRDCVRSRAQTAKSSGRSEISPNRRPPTSVLKVSGASEYFSSESV